MSQNSDITVLIPPDETEEENIKKYDNAPPNYISIMQSEHEDALIGKLEHQYGPYGICDYIKTTVVLVIGGVGRLLLLFLIFGGPPSMIVMGSLFVHSCPIQPYIPIYLLCGGISAMLSIIFAITIRLRLSHRDKESFKRCDLSLLGISNLIHGLTVSWFLAGCTFVYGIYEPSYDKTQLYCDKTVYLFSFWLLNSIFIAIGGLLILGLFLLLCSLIRS